MAESYSTRQKDWRQALHGILLALGRRAGHGGMLEDELVSVMRSELKILEDVTRDALDYLVREKLISRENADGLLVQGHEYNLLPLAVTLIAGGGDHKYIKFTNGFLSASSNVRSTGGR